LVETNITLSKAIRNLTNKYKQYEIIQMLDFLIDNIFVLFGGKVLQHPIGVPMGTDCADLFLHAYKADFLQGFLKNEDRKLAPTFNSIFRYIDVLSLNNSRFRHYLHRIYPFELEVTTDTKQSASHLDLHLEIDNGGRLKIKLFRQTRWFHFSSSQLQLPFISSNIPTSPVYGVNITQLVHYSRACVQYSDFLDRSQLLTQKLLKQGYVTPRLKSSIEF
jgi:hypothetical protein